MNDLLRNRIERVRATLRADPNGIVIGDLPAGCSAIPAPLQQYQQLAEFLRLTDGARCGGFDFLALEDLDRVQYVTDSLPGGRQRWLAFGQALYVPLLLDRTTQLVHEADQDNPEEVGRCFGTFDDLLERIFGSGYREALRIEDDGWYQLLRFLEMA